MEQFWDFFPESRVAMLVLDDNAVYTAANDAACRALGRRRDSVVGHELGFSSEPDQRAALRDMWAGFHRSGYVATTWHYRLPSGDVAVVETVCTHDAPAPGQHLALYWPRRPDGDDRTLSPREEEITRLLARGLTGEQIAKQLYLSPETVRTHVRNAMVRMRARTRAQLIALAFERGLISAEP